MEDRRWRKRIGRGGRDPAPSTPLDLPSSYSRLKGPMLASTPPTEFPLHLLFPLASSLLYVAAALSLRRAAEARAGVWRSTFVMNVVAAVCFLPLLFGPRGPGPTPWWQVVVVAALFVGGQALTMLALNRGDVSVATP